MRFSKEFKIGVLAIISILFLILGINFLKGKNLFNSESRYYIIFDDVRMLSTANQVFINGYEAGRVSTIDFDYDAPNKIIVGVDINPKMKIPNDSHGKLETSVLGDVTIHILLGSSQSFLQNGDTINGILPSNLTEELGENIVPAIEELLSNLNNAIHSINTTLNKGAVDRLLSNADNLIDQLHSMTSTIQSEAKSSLPGIVNKLDSLETSLLAFSEKINSIELAHLSDEMSQLLNQFSVLMQGINQGNGSIGQFVNDNTFYNNLDSLVHSIQVLVDNIKNNPKKYIKVSVF